MGVTDVHQLHGVRIHPDSFGSEVLLGGIQSQAINSGTQVIRETSAGDVYPEVANLVARSPGAAFATTHVKEALDALGIRGLCIDATQNPGFQMYARKHDCPGPATGNVHRLFTFNKGLLLPRSITTSHQQNAVLAVDMIGVTDGTNDTIVITDNQATPSIPRDTDRFTMDKMTVATTAYNGKKSITVDFGIGAFVEGSDSEIENSFAGVQTVEPVITVTGIEIVDWFANLNGNNPVHGNSEIYLKKRGVADATPEHIKITFNGLSYVTTLMDASGTSPATDAIVIETTKDETNAPLIINTASAIT